MRVERDDDGRRRLVASEALEKGEEILVIQGTRRHEPTRFSIQVGVQEHLDDMGRVDATNHACEPSAFVDLSEPDRVVLRALRALSAGDEISIHYCATEYDMESPFDCDCGADACMGRIRGYRYLPDLQVERLRAVLSPALRGRPRG